MATLGTLNLDLPALNLSSISLDELLIDPRDLASLLRPFVEFGSKRFVVTITDLEIVKGAKVPLPSPITLDFLLEEGNCFFDCLFYLALPIASRRPVQSVPDADRRRVKTPKDIAEAVFYQWFMIYTRGRASESTTNVVGRDVPKFLYSVMNLQREPVWYAESLASFSLNKIDPTWVELIPLGGVARETQNRFGLGVAGYRWFSPFRLLRPDPELLPEYQEAYDFVMRLSRLPPSWALHPATRDANLISRYGPLNAGLQNLAYHIFNRADLQRLVDSRAIYALPTYEESQAMWRNWSGIPVMDDTRNIF